MPQPSTVVENDRRIHAYDYNADTKVLSVHFKDSTGKGCPARCYYEYEAVPPELFTELVAAQAKDAFVKDAVIKRGYVGRRVDL